MHFGKKKSSDLGKIIKKVFKPIINEAKGKIGETKVEIALNFNFFNEVEHRQFNNLIIVDDVGISHQIDHVEIRKNGIFCIETKNYQGLIFGGENQKQWTQVLYNEKHKFLNPIKQNKSHIYQINKLLDGMYKINSLIVMVQNNADNIDVPYVLNLKDLRMYVESYYDGTELSDREMDAVYGILQEASRNEITNQDHIKNIHTMQENIKNNICPRCNGNLILKKGKYGSFLGCENYPKCKFTKKI